MWAPIARLWVCSGLFGAAGSGQVRAACTAFGAGKSAVSSQRKACWARRARNGALRALCLEEGRGKQGTILKKKQ